MYVLKFLFLINVFCVFNVINTLSSDELFTSAGDLSESNVFLKYIFEKYGNNNGKISYEGFEHLLENLGLGRLKFEKEHSLDEHKKENGYFKEMHEIRQIHKHNHSQPERRRRSSKINSGKGDESDSDNGNENSSKLASISHKQCFTPEEMLLIYNLEPNHKLGITPTNFLRMCPVIVYELDQKSCSYNQRLDDEPARVKMDSVYYVWLSATVSVLVISVVGLLGVCIVPLLQKAFFNELLSFLAALAVGTLCGDAFLHLLPHAFEKEKGEGSHVVILKAGAVFLAIISFFLIETILCRSKNKVLNKDDDTVDTDLPHRMDIQMQENSMLHGHAHNHSHGNSDKRPSSVSSIACMVIMGDGLHNFTDGLAIGAAFSGDIVSGFSTTIAVFTHELPHELGDFAVLLQTGMSVGQAVFYNIISSVLSFIGMIAGLLLGNFSSASHWIYAVTAGAFLYIGLVNLVPVMKRPIGNQKTDILIQVSGIVCGGLIMFFIALFEHDLEKIFLQ